MPRTFCRSRRVIVHGRKKKGKRFYWLVSHHDKKLYIFFGGGKNGCIIDKRQTLLLLVVVVFASHDFLLDECEDIVSFQEQACKSDVATAGGHVGILHESARVHVACDVGQSSSEEYNLYSS